MKALEIKDFTKCYKKLTAVDNISFEVESGEIFGFIGQNGAGKSTTIRTVLNMIFPTQGSIKVLGMDCVKETKEIKKVVSYVPGEVAYYKNIKVNDLFAYAMSFCKTKNQEKCNKLCEYFELDPKRKIQELSLGNKKKVSIIQALLKEPKLIILDEPTSGLDPLMQEKLFSVLLEEKKKGVAIFLSSHNLSEVEKYCDRVAVIKNGILLDISSMDKYRNSSKKKVSYRLKSGEEKTMYWEEDINKLTKELSMLDLESLVITHQSVEDEFMQYYDSFKQ